MVKMNVNQVDIPEPHGGNVYRFVRESDIPVEEVLDFSASINPFGLPPSAAEAVQAGIRSVVNYPDPDAAELVDAIAGHMGVPPRSIICGNGSTELIYFLPRALRPESVLIPAPTFSEYERACLMAQKSGAGCKKSEEKDSIKYYSLDGDNFFDIDPSVFIRFMEGCDMAFLCNPNNPTGRVLTKDQVMNMAEAARSLGCYLVVDEAFIDFVPEESVIGAVRDNPFLIVLRSMTKFYALSGLRLGYGVFPRHVMETLKDFKEPWTVNTLAMKAGVAAIKDAEYRRRSLEFMRNEKEFFENELVGLGVDFIPSSANFYLLNIGNAREVVSSLGRKGILVRDCSNFSGLESPHIRVAVKSRKDNVRLLNELNSL
ncbi:MAG TPA: threonine-phosphate decarboxylase [Nitrospirae bacterium]|nr:threonine-phosphate decarboxylase [Nitrospirota bacterium]HDO36070.1 threonine-phosphate decarboxylase [Nitrospirota bacterium]HDZ88176.1 threonine-phosphate decarboxylase [Nitrospirota bacterium]